MVPEASKALELSQFGIRERRQLSAALRAGRVVRLRMDAQRLSGLDPEWISPMVQVEPTGNLELDRRWSHWAGPEASRRPGPSVTVVIPTHRRLPIGLQAWAEQDVAVRTLVLSNGPSGPTTSPHAEVVRVPWKGHGATRQSAIDRVQDDYVLFTVDDAIPLGRGFLRRLVDSLESGVEGEPWDAVIARQLPWPDADPITVSRLQNWTPPDVKLYGVSQADHVATLYRTEDLRREPFPDVCIAEDAWWSRNRRIACDPLAPIVHSHRRRPLALYRRNRDIHRERIRMGEKPTVENGLGLVRALPSCLRPFLSGRPVESMNQLAELLGQYRGGRREADPSG